MNIIRLRTRLPVSPALLLALALLPLSGCGGGSDSSSSSTTTATTQVSLEGLGSALYFDSNLSEPAGQSCSSCHLPSAGFADPDKSQPTSRGAVTGRFGNRNSPTAAYAAYIPGFRLTTGPNGTLNYAGGQFWDGRANSLEEQAEGPFLNVLEMNNPSKQAVVDKVKAASYASDFLAIFGASALDNADTAYTQIAQAIAAFESSSTFSPFTSKYDAVQLGLAAFSVAEQQGQALFNGKGQCSVCHSSPGSEELFTNFVYHNIGVPANPNNPYLYLDASLNPDGTAFVDLGLGAVVNDSRENGKFRTPTLRNITATAPYMHNGVFATLEEVIAFYNRRDLDAVVPEVNQNVDNGGNIGNLGLSNSEVLDLIAFLGTLSDGYLAE